MPLSCVNKAPAATTHFGQRAGRAHIWERLQGAFKHSRYMDSAERVEQPHPGAHGQTSGMPLALPEQAADAPLATTLARRPLVLPPPPPQIATPAKQRDERTPSLAGRRLLTPRVGVDGNSLPAPAVAAQPAEAVAGVAAASVLAADSSDSGGSGGAQDPTRERLRALTRQVAALKLAAHTKLLKRVRQLEHQVARHINFS